MNLRQSHYFSRIHGAETVNLSPLPLFYILPNAHYFLEKIPLRKLYTNKKRIITAHQLVVPFRVRFYYVLCLILSQLIIPLNLFMLQVLGYVERRNAT
jgi:hypothetical protein